MAVDVLRVTGARRSKLKTNILQSFEEIEQYPKHHNISVMERWKNVMDFFYDFFDEFYKRDTEACTRSSNLVTQFKPMKTIEYIQVNSRPMIDFYEREQKPQERTLNTQTEPLVKCCDCKYWSGLIGSPSEYKREYRQPIESKVLICAVRLCPQPDGSELELVDGRLAHASHDCNDFEQKIQ